MKLLYDPIATTCRPVLLFVHEHDLAVELAHVDILAGGTREDTFLALNPNGAVPLLVDGDLVLPESSSILKYLADKAGSPAYPQDLKTRARINAAMDWFNTGLSEDLNHNYVYPKLFTGMWPLSEATIAEVGQASLARARARLTVLDQHMLGGRRYVCGPEITIADYLGAVFVGLGEGIGFDLSPWPNVAAWMTRMRSRPAWGEAHAAFYGFTASRRRLAAAD